MIFMAWKYQDVLNTDLAILFTIAVGFLSLVLKVFAREDSNVFTKFLFKFALAASVIQGLGLKTDLYDGEIWRFVGAFLVMRAIMLLACTVVFGLGLRRSLGEVTANWMSTTWISTVILGTPILKALLGPASANLGVVAGISSFIFQLPVMLILFEVDAWRQAHLHATLPQSRQGEGAAARALRDTATSQPPPYHPAAPLHDDHPMPLPATSHDPASFKGELLKGNHNAGDHGEELHGDPPGQDPVARQHSWTAGVRSFRLSKSQLLGIGMRLLHNHVLWGCLIGIILSLSKIGPKWLYPGNLPNEPNCQYAIGAGFIFLLLDYFARCTEPVALFATGMWMHQRNPLGCGLLQAVLYMVVKLVLVPMLMVGCAFMLDLDNVHARAAVLVAALPVSSATFALCKMYGVGENAAVANVVLGNLLVLPTTIAWLSVMDAINLFETGPLKMGKDPCSVPPAPKGL